jgi:hypothetical protein
LAAASREKTWAALHSLAAILNAVSQHYMQSTTSFDVGLTPPGGALSLLYVIDDGVRAEKERRERLKSGNVLSSDFNRNV